MKIKTVLLAIPLLGLNFGINNLYSQTLKPGYKDSSQMITREELKKHQEENKARSQKARAEKRTKAGIVKTNQIRQDSLIDSRKLKPSVKNKSRESQR